MAFKNEHCPNDDDRPVDVGAIFRENLQEPWRRMTDERNGSRVGKPTAEEADHRAADPEAPQEALRILGEVIAKSVVDPEQYKEILRQLEEENKARRPNDNDV